MSNGSDKNGNGTKFSFKLEKELWMWRGFAIFLLCMLLVLYYIDARSEAQDRNYDNRQRAEHWAKIEAMIQENRSLLHQALATDSSDATRHFQAEADSDRSQRSMILKNYEAIQKVDEHLRECVGCHSHGEIKLK
jgi:hypothetical protein